MEKEQAKRVVETLLYMADHALSALEVSGILELKAWDEPAVLELINELSSDLVAKASASDIWLSRVSRGCRSHRAVHQARAGSRVHAR